MSRVRDAYDGTGGGSGVDTDKAKRWGIERLWFEHDDPRMTKANLAAVRNRGVGVGIKMNGDGAALADSMDARLTALGFGSSTGPFSCGAMFDSETHDWVEIEAMYDEWRKRRWARYTILTFEPWQAPAIPGGLIRKLNADLNCMVAVQGYMDYTGDQLYPAYLPAVLNELERVGILKERLTGFLPVKAGVQVPFGWEGIWWTLAGLPAVPPAPL